MSVIQVNALEKYYDSFHAVKGIDFEVNKGEILGLLGPNGAGKSTTIRTICGYITPSKGSIHVNEKSVIDYPRETKKQIGYLSENAPLQTDMLAYEYLVFVAKMKNVKNIDERIKTLANLCHIEDKMNVKIGNLSKGLKQRVGLAHAMIDDPEILILDEPTSGLDPNQIADIRKLIRKIGKEKTIILSTHIMQEVEAVCDRVIIINKGQVVANETTKALKNSSTSEVLLEVTDNKPSEKANYQALKEELETKILNTIDIIKKVNYKNVSSDGINKINCIISTIDEKKDSRAIIYNKIKKTSFDLLELRKESKSLETVFRELTN